MNIKFSRVTSTLDYAHVVTTPDMVIGIWRDNENNTFQPVLHLENTTFVLPAFMTLSSAIREVGTFRRRYLNRYGSMLPTMYEYARERGVNGVISGGTVTFEWGK